MVTPPPPQGYHLELTLRRDEAPPLDAAASSEASIYARAEMRRYRYDGLAPDGLCQHVPVHFALNKLLAASTDSEAYGQLLSEQLFTGGLRDAWSNVRGYARSASGPLRCRLRLEDERLHGLRWELLRDPISREPLALSQHVHLARQFEARDQGQWAKPDPSRLRALVAVANPTNLHEYGLDPINDWGHPGARDSHPLTGASWYEAHAFCRWLTSQASAEGWLQAGFILRLPCVAEWLVAAAWSPADQALLAWPPPVKAPWAVDADALPGRELPPPVGCFSHVCSRCGPLDMAGGVAEWTAILFGAGPDTIATALLDLDYKGAGMVNMTVCGGSYRDQGRDVCWHVQAPNHPATRFDNVGFRVVLAEAPQGA